MTFKNRRSKACAIDKSTKIEVTLRDNGRCILCHSPYGLPNAHYIPRSKGGLGIKENIVTLCPDCHYKMDQTEERKTLLGHVKRYLERFYPDFQDKDRIYKK